MVNEPNISLNKFAEYNQAKKAAKRQQILHNAKFPQDRDYPPYYGAVKKYILNFFIEGDVNELNKALAVIKARKSKSKDDFIHRDNKASTTLINNAKKLELPKIPKGAYYVKNDLKNKFLNVEGLKIIMFPELLIFNSDDQLIGGVKFHHSKSPPLEEASLLDVGLLLFNSLNKEYPEFVDYIDRKYCYGVDVSTANIVRSPKSFKQREKDLSGSCREIVSLWASLESK